MASVAVPDELRYYLREGTGRLGVKLTKEQEELFVKYYQLLIEHNRKFNLTSITGTLEVVAKHFLDSLSCALVQNFSAISSAVDVGSGAGFPGLPLKIVYPHLQVVLLEARKKRANFLSMTAQELHLQGLQVSRQRAETAGKDEKYREKFELAVSRAVAELRVLAEYCLPLVKVEGRFLALKGPGAEIEVELARSGIHQLGGEVELMQVYQLPFTGEIRSIVTIKKRVPTPGKYPRRPGIPKKRPL